MDYTYYVVLVAIAAILYSLLLRFINDKFGNKQEMQKFQEESKRLSDEYSKASKANDKIKMDQVMKEQMETLPKMNGMMLNQFKLMIPILIVFFVFTWSINNFDPTLKNHFTVSLNDLAKDCDKIANDGVFTGCTYLNSSNIDTTWAVIAKGYDSSGGEISENFTLFSYGQAPFDQNAYYKQQKGTLSISVDKKIYSPKDKITIQASGNGLYKADAILNNGESFYVDLPFTIPFLNVKRIHEPYWWFLFLTVIIGLLLSIVQGLMTKKPVVKQLS
ncbi:MAG: EMC3/TMCO1 family protein [Candidatus Micrarchaeota archaeon]